MRKHLNIVNLNRHSACSANPCSNYQLLFMCAERSQQAEKRHQQHSRPTMKHNIKLDIEKLTVDLKARHVTQHNFFYFFTHASFLTQFLPTHIWHIWLCPNTQTDTSQTQKSQIFPKHH